MTRGFCSTNGKAEGSLGSREYSSPQDKKPGEYPHQKLEGCWGAEVGDEIPISPDSCSPSPALGVAHCRQLRTLGAAPWEGGLVEGYTELDRQRAICTIKLQIWLITNYSLIIIFFTCLFIGCNYKPSLPKLVVMGMPQEDAILAPVSFLQLAALRCNFANADPRAGMETQSPLLILITGGCFFWERCTGNMHFNSAWLGSAKDCCLCLWKMPRLHKGGLWVRQGTEGAALNIPLTIPGE